MPPPAEQNEPVTGSQINSVPLFNGEEGIMAEQWCEAIDRFQKQYSWSDARTATAAESRLRDHALLWLGSTQKMGLKYEQWPEFRAAIIERFYPTINELTACHAVSKLDMKADETCSQFFDRVVVTVDKLYANFPAALRQNEAYSAMLMSTVFAFFASGIPQYMREQVLGSDKPPDSAAALLKGCKAVESQRKAKGVSVHEIKAENEQDESASSETTLQAILAELKARKRDTSPRALQRFTGDCYYCHKKGHYQRDCFAKQRDEQQQQARKKKPKGKGFGKSVRGPRQKSSGQKKKWGIHEMGVASSSSESSDDEEIHTLHLN